MWEQLFTLLQNNQAGFGWLAVIIILSGIIEISPIRLNPWSTIKSFLSVPKKIDDTYSRVDFIGHQVDNIEVSREEDKRIISSSFSNVNSKIDELNKKIEDVEKEVNNMQAEKEENRATAARLRILSFGEKIMNHKPQSEEYFKQILIDIDKYEKYCLSHPDFQNNITTANSQAIKEVYKKCVTGEDGYAFLEYKEKEKK